MKKNSPNIKRIFAGFLILALLLVIIFPSIVYDPNGIPGDYSEDFVIRKIEADAGLRPAVSGGFLHLPEMWAKVYGSPAYRSNPGWQGIVLGSLYRPSIGPLKKFVNDAKLVLALLVSGLILMFMTIVNREFGIIPTVLVFITYCLCPAINAWGMNLYWMLFLNMSTGIVCWWIMQKPYSNFRLFLVAGTLVFLKSLTGYEWVSTVALNAGVPVIYFGVRDSLKVKEILWNLVRVGLATVIGFLAAFGIHLSQGLYAYGNFKDAIAPILSKAYAHSAVGDSVKAAQIFYLDPSFYPHDAPLVQVVHDYLAKPVLFIFNTPLAAPLQLLLACFLAAGLVVAMSYIKRSAPSRTWRALFCSVIFALVSVLSWVVLMQSHSQVHININYVLFTFLFMPLAVLTLFQSAKEILRMSRHRPSETGSAPMSA